MLLVNGVVYTANDRQPVAEAVAIDGNTITAVGLTVELQKKYTAETVIDMKGRTVVPGFIDSHAHLEGIGAALMNLDVSGTTSAEGAGAIVSAAARNRIRGGWIRGRGWDQNRWPGEKLPGSWHSRPRMSRVPGIPQTGRRACRMGQPEGHADRRDHRANARPPGRGDHLDVRGNPTGVFVDNAISMLEAILPPPSEEERTEAIRRGVAECISLGLTEVHDMGVDLQGVELYRTLIAAGRFPFRVYVALDGSSRETWERLTTTGPLKEEYDGRLTVRALKLYADGALGSRGAALFEQYADDPGNRGLTLTSKPELLKAAGEALESGFQLCTHAIGDRANSIVLDVYEEAFKSHQMKNKDVRFRVEHAQVLAPSDIPRFNSLNVLPMMQPTHCTSDMPWAELRLGPIRINGAYAWRSLREHGVLFPPVPIHRLKVRIRSGGFMRRSPGVTAKGCRKEAGTPVSG